MKHSFDCAPTVAYPGDALGMPLVFTWDELTGAVDGPGAAVVRQLVAGGEALAGGHPRWVYELNPSAPLSVTDVAAIVGHAWHVPADLLQFYPAEGNEPPEKSFIGDDGIPVIGADQMVF